MRVKIKKKILSILFWSVLAAAFIGPGTVVSATQAGIFYNFQLMWALVFSTFATILLQEASARITIHTQMNLGEAIAKQFEHKSSKKFILFIIIVAIILGCAAYETGNILGAVAGMTLIFDIPGNYFVAAVGVLVLIIFAFKAVEVIAKILGVVVFLMGGAFIYIALALDPDWGQIVSGSFVPQIPEPLNNPHAPSIGMLILALIGTTVVPYDLFLGSGALDKKDTISEMRFGLAIAIGLGGLISMSIIGIGDAVTKNMATEAKNTINIANLEDLYALMRNSLEYDLGSVGLYLFGFGMFAAGFSSAVTSPLASAITAKSLFSNKYNKHKWEGKAPYFKLIIIGVLSVGLTFGFLGIKPLPAILMAQAFNGLILPLIAVFLIYVINDSKVMGKANLNGWVSNIAMGVVLFITIMLGFNQITDAVTNALDITLEENALLTPLIIGSAIISLLILLLIYRNRIKSQRHEPENALANS